MEGGKRGKIGTTAIQSTIKKNKVGLPAKMEVLVDTHCFLTQPKEGQQKILKLEATRTTRKSNCMEV